MKKTNLIRLLVLVGVFIASINTAWASWYVRGSGTGLNDWNDASGAIMTQSSSNSNLYYYKVNGACEFKVVDNPTNWTCTQITGSSISSAEVSLSNNGGNVKGGPSSRDWYVCCNSNETRYVWGIYSRCIASDNLSANSWVTTENSMDYDGDNTFTITLTSVSASAHKFKIVYHGSWDDAVGWTAGKISCTNCDAENADGNIKFTPYGTGDVTITYNKSSGNITITCTAPTITFDKEGGSSGTNSQSTPYGTATSSISIPSKTGHDFGGYWTGDNGTVTQVISTNGAWIKNVSNYTNNETPHKWIIKASGTLYAKWTPSVYNITWKDQGNKTYSGSNGGSLAATYTYGTGIPTLTAGLKTGYDFGGWYDNSSCTGVAITTISTTATGAKTFYAKWTASTYDVTLSPDNGGSTQTVVATYNAAMPSKYKDSETSVAAPSFDGYAFQGYYDDHAGAGTQYYNSSAASARIWNKASTATLYAKWTQTVDLDKNTNAAGATSGSAGVTYKKSGKTSFSAASRTGYTCTGYYTATSSGYMVIAADGTMQSTNANISSYIGANDKWVHSGATTLYAYWTANSYDVTLKPNGATTGSDQTVSATYDASMPSTTTSSTAVTAPSKTGYSFTGFWDNSTNGSGTKYYNANLTSAHNWDKATASNLWAQWSANSYNVTLDIDEANHGTIDGKATSASVTFDAAPTAIAAGQLPTAAQGYAFMGFFTAAGGEGVQVINANGTWIASVTGYTDGSGHWILADDATLYAYYKNAEITGIALSSGTVLPNGSVTATATIEPTPTPTTIVCWKLLYNNGTEYSPQPTFTPASGNVVSFNAPEASGTYKVQAQLRTGGVCGSGTLLSENETSFIVAGTHNVTIQYKCDGVNVKAATVIEGVKPLDWSEAITPGDEPFGYTFARWEAGDGVTISTDRESAIVGTTTTTPTIYIKAIYDGRLTAVYTQKQMIYFKNTLGWSSVYVNFYTADYWNASNGSGNNGVTNRNKAMTRIDDTDIWYYDYGTDDITPTRYVSFTEDMQEDEKEKHGYENFYKEDGGENVVYPARRADDLLDKAGAIGFYAATPMFVPLAGQTPVKKNSDKANYYNSGYWTKYIGGTGYTLEVYYDSDSSEKIKDIAFSSADELMPLAAVANLEASTTYRFQIKRAGDVYYGNAGTMTYADHGQNVAWEMSNEATRRNDANTEDVFAKCKITTTAAGDYTFNLSYSGDNSNPVQYRLRMEVDYPIANGDYRVIYTDNTRSGFKPSAIVTKAANHKDTVSFFIRPKSSPVMKIQQSSVTDAGVITWNDLSTITSSITGLPKDSVYNICLTMNESGEISVENIEGYDGYFYIRTDAANSKWDNYRAADHQMTYSEYAAKKTGSDYTHYWMAHVDANANVKFVIANDYSPCISDTLIQQTARGGDASHVNASGEIQAEANIRYMWDMRNNAVMRAYLAPAQTDGSKFLVLQGQDTKLLDPDGNNLSDGAGNNHGGGEDAIQFTDKENWMYDAEVKAVPGGRVKLYAVFNGSTFYYYGDNDASFDDPHAIDLIGGSGDAQNIRVVYDFKTDRLIAAWVPSDGDISAPQTISADIMLIREHQNAGKQINLKGTGSISTDKTVYGVMRFNRWTLNNKSTINTGTTENPVHEVLPIGEQKSQYERFNYMISFPFDVKVGEIFGFGTIGRHYRIYYYDGLGRAKEGFFAERGDDNWRMIDDTDSILHANQGYLLQLNYIRMADDNTATWPQKNMNEVELYFPAMNEINTIQLEDVEIPALGDAYKCKINLQPTYHALNNPDSVEADRRVKDSYWRCIGVPGFTSYEANAGTWENFNWKVEADSLPYLYEWQMDDNKLSVVSSTTFTFLPMHAYLIQNGKSFTWKSVAHPTVAAPRRSAAEEGFYEFYLEMQNGEQALDHTYVRLTDKENITADFDFGQDLSKELNSGANIFTKVGYERLAANNLPLSEQTTIVPVGVKIAAEGNYTFAMPEGTHGIGVTLVDNETGDRTNLSLFDYSVNLTKGDYDNRFILEISPIQQMPTDIDNLQGESAQSEKARKVMIDGILYIVKDGKVFDAQGKRLQ